MHIHHSFTFFRFPLWYRPEHEFEIRNHLALLCYIHRCPCFLISAFHWSPTEWSTVQIPLSTPLSGSLLTRRIDHYKRLGLQTCVHMSSDAIQRTEVAFIWLRSICLGYDPRKPYRWLPAQSIETPFPVSLSPVTSIWVHLPPSPSYVCMFVFC